jgi:hypothetical protein
MRAYTLDVRSSALEKIYADYPAIQEKVENSAGYFFGSNFSIHPGLLTFANGYGVVEETAGGEQTFLRWTRFGIGPGLSIKGFYNLLIINDPELLDELKSGTWASGAFAEASFVFGDFGGEASATGMFTDHGEAYLFTHTGFSLEATIAFGKISPKEEYNEGLEQPAAE